MSLRLLCLLLLLASMAHAESPGEEAFRAAADWTVQVRTAVSQPFIEDDQGSWLGAGMLVDAKRGWVPIGGQTLLVGGASAIAVAMLAVVELAVIGTVDTPDTGDGGDPAEAADVVAEAP